MVDQNIEQSITYCDGLSFCVAPEKTFDNAYWNEFKEGIYVDITTGKPLFISTDKFESDCGWSSFSKPIRDSLIA